MLMIFTAALWALHRELHHNHLQEIRRNLSEIPLTQIWLAIGLAAANYLVLVAYDLLALRSIGRSLPLRKVALASFTGCVTSFNFGHLIGGTSVCYRLCSAWGTIGRRDSAIDVDARPDALARTLCARRDSLPARPVSHPCHYPVSN